MYKILFNRNVNDDVISQLGGIIKVLFSTLSVILSLKLFSAKFEDKRQKKLELLKKNHHG